MKNWLFFLILVCYFCFKINCELELPSYDYDHGHCPLDTQEGVDCGYVDRWFIDKKDRTCKPFEYKKSGGNFNNFASYESCKRHLILTHNEKAEGCTEPPANKGQCNDDIKPEIIKWTFVKDASSTADLVTKTSATKNGDCVEFVYTGCGGNHNRYDTKEECKNACQNTKNGELSQTEYDELDNKPNLVNKFDCFVKPDVTTENPPVNIIADLENKRCIYAATDMNNNNKRRGVFGTFKECITTCYPTNEERIAGCQSDVPYQFPNTDSSSVSNENIVKRYYYDKNSKICIKFDSLKGDFDPSKNNFPSLELCASYCGAENQPVEYTAEETCLLGVESEYSDSNTANGNLNIERFYYDKETNECKSFKYGGIGGNSNNFKTIDDCHKICRNELYHLDLSTEGERCPNGECPNIYGLLKTDGSGEEYTTKSTNH